ncbi:DUF7287 family protein [Haladaptatus cibarius]|uniref:DUF7287 family protein n=1 Tax=Haladaptatus cibarius TaxID=453847 RepID=UPI0006784F94|nr:hypothetical protein [Haladaptatus cibarius]
MDDRGQTLNDYVVGISIFLLTVTFVVAFLPTVFAPFTAPIDDATTARADRGAGHLVETLSSPETPNVLNESRTAAFFQNNPESDDLRVNLGFPATARANVSIVDPDTNRVVAVGSPAVVTTAGDPLDGQPTAASSRTVVIGDDAYRLTVRVW